MLERLKEALKDNLHHHFTLWVAAVILLTLGIVGWVLTGTTELDASMAAKEVVALSENIRKHYRSRPDYWGLSTSSVIEQKIYPQGMFQVKVEKLLGFFGNEILVGRGENAEFLMPGAKSFDIIYKFLDKNQCVALASFKFEERFWLGLMGITIGNGEENRYFTWNDKANSLPIDKKTAKSFCQEKNIIIWHYE